MSNKNEWILSANIDCISKNQPVYRSRCMQTILLLIGEADLTNRKKINLKKKKLVYRDAQSTQDLLTNLLKVTKMT